MDEKENNSDVNSNVQVTLSQSDTKVIASELTLPIDAIRISGLQGLKIGKYKHFKNNYYEVFCLAVDLQGNEYVLYQEDHGDNLFWLRPYDMFFETVELDGEKTERFTRVSKKNKNIDSKISQLISKIERQEIIITHSETEQKYEIIQIDSGSEGKVIVSPAYDGHFTGYLTAHELAKRMGYFLCQINGENRYIPLKPSISHERELRIGNNVESMLKKHLNPCSIDLGIANDGFLRARCKLVDPQSVEHIAKPNDLWKNKRLKTSKNRKTKYFKIRPNETILTHTKERIKIPNDCAGKIEIKSTFARLSLSLTFGDFCNPGYEGYFPLEIKNNGRHTIIIHEGEIMGQLILIPLSGPILTKYSDSATYKNTQGYDDGTPYSFWRERSITLLRSESGAQDLFELYENLLKKIDSNSAADVNGYKERFSNTFLSFCQKKVGKNKYRKSGSDRIDTKKIFLAYTKKEKLMKAVANTKWISGLLTIVCAFIPTIVEKMLEVVSNESVYQWTRFSWLFYIGTACLLALFIFLLALGTKTFCTFDKIDVDQFIE